MANNHDVVIIGAGHNALITAYYLARAGMKPLVLERAPQVGGCAVRRSVARASVERFAAQQARRADD
jgi:phytoene dehydrogenase-like protein